MRKIVYTLVSFVVIALAVGFGKEIGRGISRDLAQIAHDRAECERAGGTLRTLPDYVCVRK